MNVILVTNFPLQIGSANTSRFLSLADLATRAGFRVHVVVATETSNVKREMGFRERLPSEAAATFVPRRLEPSKGLSGLASRLANRMLYLKDMTHALGKTLSKSGRSIVILYSSTSDFTAPALFVSRWYRSPIIMEVNELMDRPEFIQRHGRIAWLRHRVGHLWLSRFTQGVVTISSRIRDEFEARGIPNLTLPALINGSFRETVEHEQPKSLARDFPTVPVFVYVGSDKPEDGLSNFLEASALALDGGLRHTIQLVGPRDKLNAAVNHAKVSLGISNTTNWSVVGLLSEYEYVRTLRTCDGVILPRPKCPTNDANFPTRLPEFLLVGAPTVIGNSGDVKHFLRDGTDAILLQSSTPEEIKSALITLADSPLIRCRMRDAGPLIAERCFTVQAHVYAFKSFLDQVAAAHSSCLSHPERGSA